MYAISTEIGIDASAPRVWAALVDFAAYPLWNPFVRFIAGDPRVGAVLTVSICPPGGRGMTFRPVVVEATPGRALRWRGSLVVRGLFDGEHTFRIEPVRDGAVRFVHEERFSGLFVPLARRNLAGATRAGFVAMNAALKARVESGVV